jgi:hypothetical protein
MEQDAPEINWNNLIQTLEYFKSQGYTYLEVPWIVPEKITAITFDREDVFVTKLGDLVGSAEQSFLDMNLRGTLPKGKFCALTPCFRSEKEITNLKRFYFMKVELIHTDVVDEKTLLEVTTKCLHWFSYLLNDRAYIVTTENGYDIEYKGIELGSYGIREYSKFRSPFKWLYATGIAEPRFSQAKINT